MITFLPLQLCYSDILCLSYKTTQTSWGNAFYDLFYAVCMYLLNLALLQNRNCWCQRKDSVTVWKWLV